MVCSDLVLLKVHASRGPFLGVVVAILFFHRSFSVLIAMANILNTMRTYLHSRARRKLPEDETVSEQRSQSVSTQKTSTSTDSPTSPSRTHLPARLRRYLPFSSTLLGRLAPTEVNHIAELQSAGLTFVTMSLNEEDLKRYVTDISSSEDEDEESPSKKPKLIDTKKDCAICCIEFKVSEMLTPCRKCSHKICTICVTRRFETAMKDQGYFPARCCQLIMHPAVFQSVTTAEDLTKFKTRLDETQASNPLYCPINTCSAFIPPRHFAAKTVRHTPCMQCGTKVCKDCKHVYEDSLHECYQDLEGKAILKNFKYKRCPKCQTAIARMYGCNHVRCHCGAHFCWTCRESIGYCGGCDDIEDEDDEMDSDDDEDNEGAMGEESRPENSEHVQMETTIPSPVLIPETANETTAPVPALNSGPINEFPTIPDDQNPEAANDTTAAASPTDPPADNNATAHAHLINLDDPNASTDWEVYQLGDDPEVNELDPTFNCDHNFSELKLNALDDAWVETLCGYRHGTLKDIGAVEQDLHMDCMRCWEMVRVPSKEETSTTSGGYVMEFGTKQKQVGMWVCNSCGLAKCKKCWEVTGYPAVD